MLLIHGAEHPDQFQDMQRETLGWSLHRRPKPWSSVSPAGFVTDVTAGWNVMAEGYEQDLQQLLAWLHTGGLQRQSQEPGLEATATPLAFVLTCWSLQRAALVVMRRSSSALHMCGAQGPFISPSQPHVCIASTVQLPQHARAPGPASPADHVFFKLLTLSVQTLVRRGWQACVEATRP